MFRHLLNFIRDLFRRSPAGAATLPPQTPPTGELMGQPPVDTGQPIERTIERQSIPGTIVSFTITEAAYTGPNGSLDRVRDVSGIIGGCRHLITDYDHLGGSCQFCQLEAQELLSTGGIDVYGAQTHPLYCRDCRSGCDACHLATCRRHVTLASDGVSLLCPACLQQAKRAQLVSKVLHFVISPFVDSNDDQPSSGAGK